MMLVISVPEEKEAALRAKPEARGASAGQYVEKVLDEQMAAMPADAASEHDRYPYGWPKRHS